MAMLTRLTSSGATTAAVAAPGSPKALQRFQNCVAFLWPALQSSGRSTNVQRKSTQIDAIDSFTNELVERKSKKWEELRESLMKKKEVGGESTLTASPQQTQTKTSVANSTNSFTQSLGLMSKAVINDLHAIRSPELGLDIRSLSQAQLDNLLMSTLEIKNKVDFLYLVRQCIRWQQLPSNEVLISCLKYLSSLSRIQQIESFAEICKKQSHPLSKIYADLAPFKAMAMWRSGGAEIALMTLHRGYESGAVTEDGKRMMRAAFRTIAEETLAQKSEAVLVSLMEVARSIYNTNKDIFVVACVWKQCFVSDWFCDQKSAADLFEHYEELQQLVAKRSSSLCASFLSRNNVDAVHRLIEVFLQYKQREACSNCLSLLFNYQYNRKDLRACAEIIKSCSELEMPLNEVQNEQFLSLFLNQNDDNKDFGNGPVVRNKSAQKPQKEFQYKF
ncbi:uncharacterized protein LOC111677843 [Lucilia cuprina]|uniref:uncharacterized protein LOC111677843 n=1 Tax=Lucilia cuprina TaxID=7375 RepID=UPI001F056791|nr:uncharacterized protein LOC111677843 [Lucilia cuprina]